MQAIYNRAMGFQESNLHWELTAFPHISLVGSFWHPAFSQGEKPHFTAPAPITFTARMHCTAVSHKP